MIRPGDTRAIDQEGTWQFLIDLPTADVAATAIRKRLASGETVAGMVPPAVAQHIHQHRLYLEA
jgi:nicotinate-nucleotide adenylyltransferase